MTQPPPPGQNPQDPFATVAALSSVRFESALEKKQREQRQKKEEEAAARAAEQAAAQAKAQAAALQTSLATPLASNAMIASASSVEQHQSAPMLTTSKDRSTLHHQLPPPIRTTATTTTTNPSSATSTYDFLAHDRQYIQAREAAEYAEEILAEQAEKRRAAALSREKGPLGVANRWVQSWNTMHSNLVRTTTTRSTTSKQDTTSSCTPSITISTATTTSTAAASSPKFSVQDLSMAFEGTQQIPAQQPPGQVPGQQAPPSWTQQPPQQQEAPPSWCQQPQRSQQQHQRQSTSIDYGLGQRNPEYAPSDNTNNNSKSKTASAVMGAATVGGVAGLIMAGPVVGLVGAAGLAYSAVAKDGVVGQTVRSAGSATSQALSMAASAVRK